MPLDIGIGLLLGIWLNSVSDIGYTASLFVGVVALLLPDIDFVWQLVAKRKLPNTSHRDMLHLPLLFIPLVSLFGFFVSPYIAAALALGALLHFAHDSVGIGFGVKWLFPFRENSYAVYHVHLPANQDMPRKRLYSWTDKERLATAQKCADPQWIRHIYFGLHPYGIAEYSVLLVGIIAASLAR